MMIATCGPFGLTVAATAGEALGGVLAPGAVLGLETAVAAGEGDAAAATIGDACAEGSAVACAAGTAGATCAGVGL